MGFKDGNSLLIRINFGKHNFLFDGRVDSSDEGHEAGMVFVILYSFKFAFVCMRIDALIEVVGCLILMHLDVSHFDMSDNWVGCRLDVLLYGFNEKIGIGQLG